MTGHEGYRRPGFLFALIGLLVVVGTTLPPLPQQTAAAAATGLWCLVCGDYGGVDVTLNLLLFIPFAVGLRLMGVRTTIIVAAGAAISLLIEALQFFIIVGRDASLSDVVTNTLGSLAGAVIGGQAPHLLFPTRRQAVHLAVSGAVIWLTVQAATALLLLPWSPSAGLSGIWVRSVPGRPPFDGTVTSAVVSGFTVPDGSSPPGPELARRINRGDVRVDVRLRVGTNAAVWSPVFELRAAHGPVLSLEAIRSDLAFQPAMRSHQLRLRRPALRLPAALGSETGTPVQVMAGERSGTIWARWTVNGITHASSQALGPSLGWTFITPIRHSFGPEVYWITAIWLATWLAPIGYWSAGAGLTHASKIVGMMLLLGSGLGLLPLLSGYPAVHWSEWLGGIVGLGLGYTGHRSAAYFR